MNRYPINSRSGKVGEILNLIDTWPTFDEGALTDKIREKFLDRKKAVILYLQGSNDEEIRLHTSLSAKQIYRLITERCSLTHEDGRIYGWRGLIPNQNIKPYNRIKKLNSNNDGCGHSGALKLIFDIHPLLRLNFNERILRIPKSSKIEEINTSKRSHWKWLLNELKKLGYEARYEWPFNTKKIGYQTICTYIQSVLENNPKRTVKINGKESTQKYQTGDGVNRPIHKPFSRVEMDAHKIDGRFCIIVPDITGAYTSKIIHRIWIIVIIDVFTRVVLGYHISFEKEVNQNDILRTIKNSLTQWQPKNNMISEIKYIENAGFPSYLSKDLLGICWDETSVDGALAENSKLVEKTLLEVVGSKLISPISQEPNFSKRRNKDDRPFIESFFRHLSCNGFQRLSNTTGKDHKSKHGRDPEKIALAGQFQLEYAMELIDVIIANYNATPHSSLGYRTPLEYLQTLSHNPNIHFRYADSHDIQNILSFRKKCRVNGDLKSGRAPFVNFQGARYSNEILRQRYDLIGQSIWIVNHLENDARVALANTVQGGALGVLRASPPWNKFPHSLLVRKTINSAIQRKIIHVSQNQDAIEEFLNFIENNKKIPVHPAYLEARRILTLTMEENIGQHILEKAKDKVRFDTFKSEHTNKINKLDNSRGDGIKDENLISEMINTDSIDSFETQSEFKLELLPARRKVRQH